MDQEEAERIARDYLSKCIKLEWCKNPPKGLYGFNPDSDVVFMFDFYKTLRLGSTKYLAVSKATGLARYLGAFGE